MNSRTKCVLALTPHARHNCVREDRIGGTIWHDSAKAETQDHKPQEVYPAARKFRMSSYSTHRLNSDTSRSTLCSLHLPRINSTAAQESRGNHLPSLLRIQTRGTCKLGSLLFFFFFAQARALIRGFLNSLLWCMLSLLTEIM